MVLSTSFSDRERFRSGGKRRRIGRGVNGRETRKPEKLDALKIGKMIGKDD